MRIHSILAACVLGLALGAGCSNDVVKKMGELADRACACNDTTCADKVDKEFWDYAKKNADKRGTQEERDEIQGHYNRVRECITRARAGAEAPAQSAPEAK